MTTSSVSAASNAISNSVSGTASNIVSNTAFATHIASIRLMSEDRAFEGESSTLLGNNSCVKDSKLFIPQVNTSAVDSVFEANSLHSLQTTISQRLPPPKLT